MRRIAFIRPLLPALCPLLRAIWPMKPTKPTKEDSPLPHALCPMSHAPCSEPPAPCRLALGTAQFGLPYGIANRSGQVGREEAEDILAYAWDHGINTLDTAMAYGGSETRLGEIGVHSWRVVTKLPPIPENCGDVREWVKNAVQGSLQRLKKDQLYGLLLHRPEQLLSSSGEFLFRALTELRADNLISKIGISIYDPDELDALCGRYRFDIIQAPFNILDRRLANSGWLPRLYDSGTEVHVRSIFLQGLLLMNREDRPVAFRRWAPLWEAWEEWLVGEKLRPIEACFRYAISFPEISNIIIGIDDIRQLIQILDITSNPLPMVPDNLQVKDLRLINPVFWKQL